MSTDEPKNEGVDAPPKSVIRVAVRPPRQWDNLPEWRRLHQTVARLNFKAYGLSSSSTDFENLDQSEAVEMLRELGCIVANSLKKLWQKPEHRRVIAKAAGQTKWFPVVWTNLDPAATDGDDDFRKWLLDHLRPAAGQERHRRGPKANQDTETPKGNLNQEINYFVDGVLEPGKMRRNEKDIISNKTRALLLSDARRRRFGSWSNAFVEKYIKPERPDLLSVAKSKHEKWGNFSGEWAAMVQERMGELAAKNPEEKSPWRALKQLADGALRKHRRLIKLET